MLVTCICHLQLLLTRILKEPRGRMIQIIQQWVACFNSGIIYFLLYASDSWHSWLQIFVGGLDSTVTDDLLRQVFSRFGELVHVKIPVGKRCGFVQFANRYQVKTSLPISGHPLFPIFSFSLSFFLSPNLIFFLFYLRLYFRACAEQALALMNGTQLGGQSIRLSWGRSPSNKQVFIFWITLLIVVVSMYSG